jgi:hypothetical protein
MKLLKALHNSLGKQLSKSHLPMHNMVCVAVVDALKNLLHENSCVFFGKFASCNDLVEEFSALANSILIR